MFYEDCRDNMNIILKFVLKIFHYLISLPESRRQMYGYVLMALFETTVLPNIVQIITSNDNSTLHFQFLYDSVQDTTTNANITGKWTFFVNICSIDGLKYVNNFIICRFVHDCFSFWWISIQMLHTSFGVLKPNPTSR